jgi:hypothetical protein
LDIAKTKPYSETFQNTTHCCHHSNGTGRSLVATRLPMDVFSTHNGNNPVAADWKGRKLVGLELLDRPAAPIARGPVLKQSTFGRSWL